MQRTQLFEPQVFVGADAITILFGSIPNRHTIYIDVEKDQLFFDGNRMKTTNTEFNYNKEFMFERNKNLEKKRILTFPKGNEPSPVVLAVDCGWDGRIFFKFFTRETYSVPRGKPLKVFSYWHDRRAKEKKFYNGDLHEPGRVWPAQYKKDVLVS